MSHIVAGSGTDIQRQRNRKKDKSRDERIKAKFKKIKNTFSIALLHAGRAERAYSHTCKLPIIYSDTDTLTERKRERETNADQETYLYTYNQCQHSRTWMETFREKEWEKSGKH